MDKKRKTKSKQKYGSFSKMLEKLEDIEVHYRTLFESSPISLWEEDFSEIKKRLDKLKKEGVRNLRKYFNENPQEVKILASLVRINSVNKRTLDIYKAKNIEDFKKGLRQVLTDESHTTFSEELVTFFSGKKIFEAEAMTKNLKNELINARIKALIAPGHEKNWSKIIVSIINISDINKTEEALKKSKEKYRTLAESLEEMVYKNDPETLTTTYVNAAIKNIYGYTVEEWLKDQSLRDKSIYPADKVNVHKKTAEAKKKKENVVLKYRILKKDKEIRWVEDHLSWEINKKGKIISANGLVYDITEQKKIESALKRSEKEFRDLYNEAPCAYFSVGANGLIDTINNGAAKMLGYTRKELVGMKVANLYADTAQGREKALKLFERFKSGKQIKDEELQMQKKNGNIIWINLLLKPVKDKEGNVIIIRSIAYDITKRKEAEEELRKNIYFFQSLNKINQAIAKSDNFNKMLNNVLKVMLKIFDCDRAWLSYPLDPNAPSWSVPMEITKSKYPGAFAVNAIVPMTDDIAAVHKNVLATKKPLVFDPTTENKIPEDAKKRFSILSQIITGVYPKIGKPWLMGIHQVSHERVWDKEEVELLKEISYRISDSLSSFLSYEDLQESKEELQQTSNEQSKTLSVLNNIYNTAPIGLALLDTKLRYQRINKALAEINGVPVEKHIGKTVREIVPDVAETLEPIFRRIIRTRKPVLNLEVRGVTKAKPNIQRWWLANYYPVIDVKDKVIGLQLIVAEITKRKNTEKELIKSEEKNRLLFETMVQGVVYQDRDGKITSANPAAQKILGLSLSQMQGRTSTDPRWKSIHEDGSPFPGEEHPSMQALRTGKIDKDVLMGVYDPKNNQQRWININAIPLFRTGEQKPYEVYTTFEDITEHKRTEEALRQSESHYRSLINTAAVIVLELSADQKILEFNSEAEKLYGTKRKDVLGKNYIDLFVPKKAKKTVVQDIKKVLNGRTTKNFENPVIDENGKEYIISWSVTPILDKKRNAVSVLAIGQNITESKKAQTAIVEEAKFSSNLINGLSEGFAIIDSKGTQISVNDSLSKMTGFSKKQLLNKKPPFIYWAEEDINKINKAFKETLEGQEKQYELIFKKKNGDHFTALVTPRKTKNPKGEIVFFATIRDITLQVKTQKYLSEAADKYSKLIEAANDVILVADAQTGRLIDANQRAADTIGLPKSEIINKPFYIVHPKKEKEHYLEVFKQATKKSKGVFKDLNLIDRKGNTIPVEMSSSVLKIGGRKIIQGIFRDMREQKESEEKLKQKDMQIRRAYIDVFSAVTGGKLIIVTKDELQEALGKEISTCYRIETYADLASARKRLVNITKQNFPYIEEPEELILATDEALTNTIKHAKGGCFKLFKKDNIAQIRISDAGPGIDFTTLPKATLLRGYSTKKTLGVGFDILLDVSDRVLLSTTSEGTDIVLEKSALKKAQKRPITQKVSIK